jgi:hypothetical protein
MSACDQEKLESLALGELGREESREVETHTAGCASCAEELRLFRAERAVFARRAEAEPRVPARVWLRVQDRLRPRAPFWRYLVPVGTFVVATVVTLIIVRHDRARPSAPGTSIPVASHMKLDPRKALDVADASQAEAITKLEAEYHARRAQLPERAVQKWDTKFTELRKKLDAARTAAGEDVEGRRALAFATAHYVRSLQNVLLEEAAP